MFSCHVRRCWKAVSRRLRSARRARFLPCSLLSPLPPLSKAHLPVDFEQARQDRGPVILFTDQALRRLAHPFAQRRIAQQRNRSLCKCFSMIGKHHFFARSYTKPLCANVRGYSGAACRHRLQQFEPCAAPNPQWRNVNRRVMEKGKYVLYVSSYFHL